ncbi:hypothetical protein CI610_02912 [invertebrate metagenome]|uniref:Uncharacterized protein n=1 Tax=invertebrate metagenome TaxID=1711999 RepID=A0A2H9T4L2_9ZZZZ
MDLNNTATYIALFSLLISLLSPMLAYWRISIERIKLNQKLSGKRQKMITDALRLHARMRGRLSHLLQVVIEARHQVHHYEWSEKEKQKQLALLTTVEKKLRKRLVKTSALYEKIASLRDTCDWDEEWLRRETDILLKRCNSAFLYENLEKEVSLFCRLGISFSVYHSDSRQPSVSAGTSWDLNKPPAANTLT